MTKLKTLTAALLGSVNPLYTPFANTNAGRKLYMVAAAQATVPADAAAYAREKYSRLASQSGDYGQKVAETVRNRPGESLAIAFGLGIAAGALMFLGRKK